MSWVIDSAVAPSCLTQLDDQLVDHIGHDRVEPGGRLVEEQDLRARARWPGRGRRASACRPTARPASASATSAAEPDHGPASAIAPWSRVLRGRRRLAGSRPKATFSQTGRLSNSAPPWNSMPNLRRSSVAWRRGGARRPRCRRSGSSRCRARSGPRTHLISTDLPVPEPPMTTSDLAGRQVEIDAVAAPSWRRSSCVRPRMRDLGRLRSLIG